MTRYFTHKTLKKKKRNIPTKWSCNVFEIHCKEGAKNHGFNTLYKIKSFSRFFIIHPPEESVQVGELVEWSHWCVGVGVGVGEGEGEGVGGSVRWGGLLAPHSTHYWCWGKEVRCCPGGPCVWASHSCRGRQHHININTTLINTSTLNTSTLNSTLIITNTHTF